MPNYISEKRTVISRDEYSEVVKDKIKAKEKIDKIFIVTKNKSKNKKGKK